ncbi:YolD-like family protein [Bacillus toyonensis]|uniref:YolD-like family protein n=1 Tax=Bacillus toyonensis TaxID=155322 RepID=UPI000BF08878|nr:YolD-like family protein [Bacillus toyonensis]PEJ12121.1 3-oxoacyl-ACP synthase [Bacillus toyonensis]
MAILWFKLWRTYDINHSIREILGELNKVSKPFITQDTKERIERELMRSLREEEEILITYYRDGFIQDKYITVVSIDVQDKTVYSTDAFGLQTRLKFDEFVDIN